MVKLIPVNSPLLNGNEKKYLCECIDSGWISSEGPFVKKFEAAMAEKVDRKYGVAVSSGTAALEIAVKSLEIGPGDEVIMPVFTIISCAAALVKEDVVPVLVDSDPNTWNMDTSKIESRITERTKAIMVVHIYGLPVDMDPVLAIAEKYDLKVIEDAAEAHGQYYKGKPCGCFGDVSIFSFYPNKHVTTGEGGMVLTDNESVMKNAQALRNLCFKPEKRFVHDELGWNYRMTNMQAAIGLAQLENLEEHVEKKKQMGSLYRDLLGSIDLLQVPVDKTDYAENVYWVFGMVCQNDLNAEDIMKKLSEKGVGTRPFFWPIHEQPVFKKMELFLGESYPVAENLARRGFYIPSGLGLTESDQKIVAERVKEVLNV